MTADEKSLYLAELKHQLSEIENLEALDAVTDDIIKLKNTLVALVRHKEGELLELKKANLLADLDKYADESFVNKESHDHFSDAYKCRAFYSEHIIPQYHDAIILENNFKGDLLKALVMFSHPMTEAMIPCDKFLIGVKCREECRFSHGQLVDTNQILPYEEPIFDNIDVGTKCLVKNDRTNMWVLSEIEFIDIQNMTSQKTAQFHENQKNDLAHESSIVVKNLSNSQLTSTNIYNIRPLGSDDLKKHITGSNDYSYAPGEYNTKVNYIPTNTSKIDQKSNNVANKNEIGLKLIMKMGFTPGQGLGKYEQGIKEPVKAQNKDALTAKRTKTKIHKTVSMSTNLNSSSRSGPLPQMPPMFDFLNSKCLNYTIKSEKKQEKNNLSTNSSYFDREQNDIITNRNQNSKFNSQKGHLETHPRNSKLSSGLTRTNLKQPSEAIKRKHFKETFAHSNSHVSNRKNIETKKNKYIF